MYGGPTEAASVGWFVLSGIRGEAPPYVTYRSAAKGDKRSETGGYTVIAKTILLTLSSSTSEIRVPPRTRTVPNLGTIERAIQVILDGDQSLAAIVQG